jgi:hypothetical protein
MTTPPLLTALAALAVVFLAPVPLAQAQTSEYFVMAGDQARFHVIKGGVLLRSWSPAAGTAQYQYPIVVTNTIRTMGANVSEIGAEYDLSGNDLVTRFTHPAGPSRSWDGTTDGTSHFAIDSAGGVYRFDRNWANPVLLFNAGGIGSLTYDPTNNSMWVSQFSTTNIVNYTLSGNVISTFSTGHTQNMALALDHADGTLWLHDRTTQGTFEQWSRTGTRLSRLAVAGMNTQNALGGEMQFQRVAKCTFRNGNALNPPDYLCVTRPILGTNWTTSYNSNTNTLATVLILGAGPATGPRAWNGEWLVALTPPPILIAGTGNIVLPIPNVPIYAGAIVATQGFRLDSSATGPQLLLLNAQDAELQY